MRIIKLDRSKIDVKTKRRQRQTPVSAPIRHNPTAKKEKFAEHLKANATASELKLCKMLEREGIDFVFQQVLYGYIVDFYFKKQKKIVELDGKQFHSKEKDAIRDANLAGYGLRTLRIRSHRVFAEPGYVVEEIKHFLFGKRIKKRPKQKTRRKKRLKARREAHKVIDRSEETCFQDFMRKIE